MHAVHALHAGRDLPADGYAVAELTRLPSSRQRNLLMNPRTTLAATLFLACTFTPVSRAQDVPVKKQLTPEEQQKSMEAFFSTMVPAQAKAAEASLDLLTKYAERPEVADRIAAYKKNLFESLKKRGFTSEQALQITLVTPLPSVR
jgi:hypothetical protein